MQLEATNALVDPEAAEAAEAFEAEQQLAEAGDWEAMGLDPPDDLVPASIQELRADGS